MTTARAYGGKRRRSVEELGYDPDAWETPYWLFDELCVEFRFTLDVCASPTNSKCTHWFQPESVGGAGGLAADWTEAEDGACWCNPPYSQVEKWLEKALAEAKKGVTTVCLIKADTSTKWFRRFYPLASEVRFLPRIQFIPPPGYPGKVGSPNMGHALLIFRGAK